MKKYNNLTNKSTLAGGIAGGAIGGASGLLLWKRANKKDIKLYKDLKEKKNLPASDKAKRTLLRKKLYKSKLKYGLSGLSLGGITGTVIGHELGANKEFKNSNNLAQNQSLKEAKELHKSHRELDDKLGDGLTTDPSWQSQSLKDINRYGNKSRVVKAKNWLGKNRRRSNIHSVDSTIFGIRKKDGSIIDGQSTINRVESYKKGERESIKKNVTGYRKTLHPDELSYNKSKESRLKRYKK